MMPSTMDMGMDAISPSIAPMNGIVDLPSSPPTPAKARINGVMRRKKESILRPPATSP